MSYSKATLSQANPNTMSDLNNTPMRPALLIPFAAPLPIFTPCCWLQLAGDSEFVGICEFKEAYSVQNERQREGQVHGCKRHHFKQFVAVQLLPHFSQAPVHTLLQPSPELDYIPEFCACIWISSVPVIDDSVHELLHHFLIDVKSEFVSVRDFWFEGHNFV